MMDLATWSSTAEHHLWARDGLHLSDDFGIPLLLDTLLKHLKGVSLSFVAETSNHFLKVPIATVSESAFHPIIIQELVSTD